MTLGGASPAAFVAGLDDVAAELRARAARLGMRKALARELGVSRDHLANMIAGRRTPSPRVLAKLGFRLAIVRIDESCPAASAEAKVE
jgi:transcriptional regulator with XRE-family HTH domain